MFWSCAHIYNNKWLYIVAIFRHTINVMFILLRCLDCSRIYIR